MIYRYHGLQIKDTTSVATHEEYLNSDIALGMRTEDRFLENQFLDLFQQDNNNLFIYSDYPEDFPGLGGGGEEHFVSELVQSIVYGMVANILYDSIKSGGKALFSKLKLLFLKAHEKKIGTLAVTIRMQGGASVTYKLPKYLNPRQIESAIETIEKETLEESVIQKRLWTRVTFDTKSEEFLQE